MALQALETLWFNTGTLCNLTCQQLLHRILAAQRPPGLSLGRRGRGLPRRDRARRPSARKLIGFTGGEPFMNRDLPAMLEDVLGARAQGAGADQRHEADAQDEARAARRCWRATASNLTIRVSLDHYERGLHEKERGAAELAADHRRPGLARRSRASTSHVAGRRFSGETEAEVRAGYARLFARHRHHHRCGRPGRRWCCFRRWTPRVDVPEITTACWGILEEVARQRDVRLARAWW